MIPRIYSGSVKDIYGPIHHPRGNGLVFAFSDAYSIFDWGRMPDAIPGKGLALCCIGAHFFEVLAPEVRSHYLGVTGSLSPVKPLSLNECSSPYGLVVLAASDAKAQTKSALKFIPLEVIFRIGFPPGSSALGRIKGALPNARISTPIVEFSTKLEDTDRLLDTREAAKVGSLSETELAELSTLTQTIAKRLEAEFARIGVTLWDGKLEFARDEDGFVLVDSIGPDELRLSQDGREISKEVLRAHYRQTPWYSRLSAAKAQARDNSWRSDPALAPPRAPRELIAEVSDLYRTLAYKLTNHPALEGAQ